MKQNGNTLTPVSELFSDYQASGPAFDEMISDEGVRAAYSAALRQMGKLEADEVRGPSCLPSVPACRSASSL